MRKDMGKILTERGRSGGYGSNSSRRRLRERRFADTGRRHYDDLSPRRESMRYRYQYDPKYPDDLLGPLYRFLRSRCGKPWRKVWSEVCAVMPARSMQGNHLRDHVRSYVSRVGHEAMGGGDWKPFYVDAHGALRERK